MKTQKNTIGVTKAYLYNGNATQILVSATGINFVNVSEVKNGSRANHLGVGNNNFINLEDLTCIECQNCQTSCTICQNSCTGGCTACTSCHGNTCNYCDGCYGTTCYNQCASCTGSCNDSYNECCVTCNSCVGIACYSGYSCGPCNGQPCAHCIGVDVYECSYIYPT